MEKLINFEHHSSYHLLFVFRPYLSNYHNDVSGDSFGCDLNHSALYLFHLQVLPYDKACSAPLYLVYSKMEIEEFILEEKEEDDSLQSQIMKNYQKMCPVMGLANFKMLQMRSGTSTVVSE